MLMAEGTLGNLIEPVVLRNPVTEFVDKPWAITGCKGRQPNIVNTLHMPVRNYRHSITQKYDYAGAEVRYEEF